MEDMDQIYRQYMPQVYKYLFSICHDSHLSEELTQETFYQAKKRDGRYMLIMEKWEEVQKEDFPMN